jgi:glyoxylase-like metal-dependent hydrolase (beta-lactamase superfamily II)
VFNAPGHASHHVLYFDQGNGAAFVGDNGGVCIPDRMIPRAATPPPDIDIEAWMRTLDLIESLAPQALLLTHFGPAYEPATYLDDYRATLWRWAEAVRVGLASGADEATQIARLRDVARADMGNVSANELALFEQASSVELNYQGLARYWRKRAES